MGAKDELISRLLYEMVGNDGIRVINSLSEPSTDFQIHDKTQMPITRVRIALNVLHKYNIVSYDSCREKNRSWYKYVWELNRRSIESSIRAYLVSKLMKLKGDFQEINQVDFFKCENGCMRASFMEAYDKNFRCIKCNEILKPVDVASEMRQIKRDIRSFRSMLEVLGPIPSYYNPR